MLHDIERPALLGKRVCRGLSLPIGGRARGEQASYREQGLELLERSVRQGFDDWDDLRSNSDLASLRSDPRFKKILDRDRKH